MFATQDFGRLNVVLEANITLNLGTPAGIIGWCDSSASPANYIHAYHTGDRVKLEKRVGGVVTNLITATNTYVDGTVLRLTGTVSGGTLTLDLTCNGLTIGTQQTVTDAGIVANTRHGFFSSDPTSSVTKFTII
jgi:hypothetical protein